jgi:hypothetical protein
VTLQAASGSSAVEWLVGIATLLVTALNLWLYILHRRRDRRVKLNVDFGKGMCGIINDGHVPAMDVGVYLILRPTRGNGKPTRIPFSSQDPANRFPYTAHQDLPVHGQHAIFLSSRRAAERGILRAAPDDESACYPFLQVDANGRTYEEFGPREAPSRTNRTVFESTVLWMSGMRPDLVRRLEDHHHKAMVAVAGERELFDVTNELR